MLKLLNITKEYRIDDNDVTLALNNVSIEFRQNEFVSILGPSGCGKTTLLNIVGGLDRYTSGDIQVDGVSTKEFDDVDWDTYRNQRVGFVFQSYNLIPHMNILKNVALCLTLAGVSKEERIERAMEALRKVGLADQAKKRPNQLSGGQAQRVAIARALVNNPDIILADEPTGALDTESGIQIMELLKEVASDRLVVMVTHNPQLAEEYSTRIVYLKDGEVVGDTMPYDSAAEIADEVAVDDVVVEEAHVETPAPAKKATLKDKMKKLSEKIEKFKKHDKASMKLTTAISLSWNNLISKKGRTFLTSVAGSIGIIGIILVLSLSSGASAFIASMEEDALSTYPLTVNKSSLEIEEVLSKLMSGGEVCEEHVDANSDGYCDQCNVDIDAGYDVTVLSVLGELIHLIGGTENDLHAFKKYIDENFDDAVATVKYDYGTTFNVYAEDPKNNERPADEQIYMKINPYVEAMFIVLEDMRDMLGSLLDKKFPIFGMEITINEALPLLGSMLGDSWAEMSTNQELLDSQYDVKAGRWPTSKDEVVVVLTRDGKLIDYQLFMLGLKSQDDVTQALLDGKTFSSVGFKYEELLGKSYKILTNADYLVPNVDADGNPILSADGGPTWTHMPKSTLDKEFVEGENANAMDVKIVGVVQPKEGANSLSINGVVGYTKELGDYLLEKASTHEAVQAQIAVYEKAVAEGKNSYKSVLSYTISSTDELKVGEKINIKTKDRHDVILRALGVVDLDYPLAIKFYCSSFDSKDDVEAFIKEYNEQVDTNKQIQYSDSLSSMMSFVNTMAEVITGVLVAFAAISLVVSTIMIAIIIYTSVLERRKEIGVLRSIGARKKDVARVFLAESAILGGYSGVIGVVVSCLISLAGSAILKSVFGIADIMQVEWWHAVMMLGISVLLSMLAGFVPSRVAAKKDPAIALRSE